MTRAPVIVAIALLLVAAERGVIVSTGTGILAVPDRANSTPSIASDGSRVALAWGARDATGATDVYAAVSIDGGRAFSAPVRVNLHPGTARLGGEMPPRVAISGRRVDVLWTARDTATRIVIARSEDGGRRFGPARELQDAGAAGDRGWPALSVDRSGDVHAVWLDHRGMAGGQHGSHAAPDKSGLHYSGGSGDRELAKGVCYCCKTAVASVSDRVFVAWRHVYPGNIRDIAFTVSNDRGRTFAAPVRMSEDRWQLNGCPDDGPAVAVDPAGVAHVVWPSVVDRPEPHKAIFYSWTQDGRSFVPRMRVTPVGRNAAHPQVVAHRAGVTVLWDELVDGTRQVFAMRRSRSNRSFAPAIVSHDRIAASYPVAAAVDDAVVVAWTRGGGNDSSIAVRRIPLR